MDKIEVDKSRHRQDEIRISSRTLQFLNDLISNVHVKNNRSEEEGGRSSRSSERKQRKERKHKSKGKKTEGT